jgi:hypothetical protein
MPTESLARYSQPTTLKPLIIQLSKIFMACSRNEIQALPGTQSVCGTFKTTSEKTLENRVARQDFRGL